MIHNMNRFPSEYMALSRREKAFMGASINIHAEDEKKTRADIERAKNKMGKANKRR